MASSKIAFTAIFILGVVLGIIFGNFVSVNVALAATTYETSAPTSIEYLTQTGTCCSGADNYKSYSNYLRLPIGTTFNKLQLAGTTTTGVPIFMAIMQDNGPSLESGLGTTGINPVDGDTQISQITVPNGFNITSSAIQSSFATTTITASNQYLLIITSGGNGFTMNRYKQFTSNFLFNVNQTGLPYTLARGSQALRLCLNDCDSNSFDLGNFTINSSNSFILIAEPDNGTTTASTSVDISVFYEFDGSVATTSQALIQVFDAVTNELQHQTFINIPALSNPLSFELPVNFTMSTGSKNIVASYIEIGSKVNILQPKTTFFNVIDNSYFLATGLLSPTANPYDLTQIDCTTFDIGCQFQKALTFLFIPPQTTLDKFGNVWQELKYLKPFGYVTVTIDQLKNVTSNATAAYTMPQIPFLSAIFEPLKNGIAILLWAIFAFVFYNKRLKTLDI